MSVPSDDEWPEGLTEDGDKLFLNDKLLVLENWVEALIDHWHNAQLMHPGRHKMQLDVEWRFEFPPGYYAILNRYCSDCAEQPEPRHRRDPGLYGDPRGTDALHCHGRVCHARVHG